MPTDAEWASVWDLPREIAELPDGAPVEVVWSGGNGPCRYLMTTDKWGHRRLALPRQPAVTFDFGIVGDYPLTTVRPLDT